MKVVFADEGWDDYLFWQSGDRATLKRLNRLIEDCRRSPFDGIGRPEALRENLAGFWSRRINEKDRLVYRIVGGADEAIEIVQCRGHY